MGPGPQFQEQSQFPPQFPPQFIQQHVNMPAHMNMPPPQMNMQGPPQMMNQGPPQMNMQGPPMNMRELPQMNMQGPLQMNMQGPPQMRIQFPSQNIQFSQQLPPIPAQQMSPPRPEIPQFRLINPAPQQPQMPTIERTQVQEVEGPNHQPELRIHLRRIQLPGPIGDIFPFLNNIQGDVQKEIESPRNNLQVQQMPLAMALSKVGITPDDLRNIQRMAEEKFQEHLRDLVADDDNDSDSDSAQSDEDTDSDMQTDAPEQDSAEITQKNQELHEATSQQEQSDDQKPQILSLGRSNFGRSLIPVQIPVQMTGNTEIQEAERADCKFNCFWLTGNFLLRIVF